jgi:thymidylate synthase
MIYNNVQEAFVDLSIILLAAPEQSSRVGTTRELLMTNITIKHPEQRCYVLPHRNDNIFAKIAETVWVLAGRSDIAFLSKYLPRAIDFSDDGKTWRAGYGQRMRHYGADTAIMQNDEVDQLSEVVKLLQSDRYTRRAVISLWDPHMDYGNWKDIPCNDFIQFIIRKDKNDVDTLYMTIAQRSSDIMWGFSGINTFEFSTLQLLLSHWLSCAIGTLTYNITSLHVYSQHYKRLDNIVRSYTYQSIYEHNLPIVGRYQSSNPSDSLAKFDTCLPIFFDRESILPDLPNLDVMPLLHDDFLLRCLDMLQAYWLWQLAKPNLSADLIDCLEGMPDDDWKLAAIEYIARDNKAVLDEVTTSDAVMTALLDCMPDLQDNR